MNNFKEILKRFFISETKVFFIFILILIIALAYSFLKEWKKIDNEINDKTYIIADPKK